MMAPAQVNVSSPAAVKDQAVSSGNLATIVACDSSAPLSLSTATTTQIVALVSGKAVYVCAFVLNGGGATTAKLVSGTGTNCATGQVSLTPAFTMASGTNVATGGGLGYVAKTAAGNALCVTNSAAAAVNVFVSFTQF